MVTIDLLNKNDIETPVLDRSPATLAKLAFISLKDKEIKPKTFRDKAEEIYWYLRDTWIAEFGLHIAEQADLLSHKDEILRDTEAISARYVESLEFYDDPELDSQTLGFCAAIVALYESGQGDDYRDCFSWTDEEIVSYVVKARQLEQTRVGAKVLSPKVTASAAKKKH